MAELYIGLMSGTSMDALDAVLVDFASPTPQLITSHSTRLAETLREELLSLAQPGTNELDRMAQLDVVIGQLSAQLVSELLEQAEVEHTQVLAIGSHGQTVRHAPKADYPYTLQIGDPNTIAQLSGITTVCDFRRRDMVVGGQGAPLVPAFHHAQFYSNEKNRVILNIGGIANISILPADPAKTVSGFDTGPGNMLIDGWMQLYCHRDYDENGDMARSGQVDRELLDELLRDPYFDSPPPKSTGREQFNLHWLEQHRHGAHRSEDLLATLSELTAATIAYAIRQYAPDTHEVYACGGGTKNGFLMERLCAYLEGMHVGTTAELGMEPSWVEAMAFAWLARQTLHGLPGNLPAVTGAEEPVILGGIYPAPRKSVAP